jgi:hypothetical protein
VTQGTHWKDANPVSPLRGQSNAKATCSPTGVQTQMSPRISTGPQLSVVHEGSGVASPPPFFHAVEGVGDVDAALGDGGFEKVACPPSLLLPSLLLPYSGCSEKQLNISPVF